VAGPRLSALGRSSWSALNIDHAFLVHIALCVCAGGWGILSSQLLLIACRCFQAAPAILSRTAPVCSADWMYVEIAAARVQATSFDHPPGAEDKAPQPYASD